ncbi:MAG: hypothetical protein Phog2KO_46580 [Phototrophicaceae bacterium]
MPCSREKTFIEYLSDKAVSQQNNGFQNTILSFLAKMLLAEMLKKSEIML